jgi:aconitate hydratase
LADQNKAILTADPEVAADPKKFYDQVIEIDLDKLEPYLVGPHSPDVAHPISKMKDDAQKNGYPTKLSAALIGSCTNSSYEDIGRATHIAKQALELGITMPQHFLVSPGSDQIHETIKRDGQMQVLEQTGATVLANACGPCIGQWKRDDIKPGEKNSIVTSFNRNFRGRNDSNAETLAFIGSPDIVMLPMNFRAPRAKRSFRPLWLLSFPSLLCRAHRTMWGLVLRVRKFRSKSHPTARVCSFSNPSTNGTVKISQIFRCS